MKLFAQARAVEDIVPEHQHRRLAGHEVLADDEGLCEAVGLGLLGIFNANAPFRAIAKQATKHRQIMRRGNDQRFADPCQHHYRQRIIDHRLVVDGDELLGDGERDRMQPGARAARQNNALHCR